MDKKVKYAIIVLCAAAVLLAAVIGYDHLSANYNSEVPSGTGSSEETLMAPDFTVYDREGNAVNFSDFAGTLGSFLAKYQTAVNVVTGAVVILFGLSYLEVFNLPFLKGMGSIKKVESAFGAFLFGIIYSVSLTPCVGAFLGSALMLASNSETALEGLMLLLTYSLGLGIPFVFSAVLLDKLGGTFDFIKKHYGMINKVCGIFLIVVGVFMMFGILNALLALFN